MRRRFSAWALALALAGCGGSGHAPQVENPYLQRSHDFLADGFAAMRRERWAAAERAFSRALLAAQLADDPALVRRAWYDLGMARRAGGNRRGAAEAFARARGLVGRHGDAPMAMRAWLALALLGEKVDGAALRRALGQASWPADVELMAGRWLQRSGLPDQARDRYRAAERKAGEDASGLRIKAQAALGQALLARDAKDAPRALRQSARALDWCRKVGAPRLTAHALLLRGGLLTARRDREDVLERALAIYDALGDREGARRALTALQALARSAGDTALAARWWQRLEALEPPAGGEEGS